MDSLKDFLHSLEEKLTPDRRKQIYKLAVLLGGILVAHQALKAEDLKDWLEVLALILLPGAPALAHKKVSTDA